MDCAVLDIGGNFLGPALGLRQLGHRVRYWTDSQHESIQQAARMAGILEPEPVFQADVFFYAASFSDEQWASELGIQQEAELRPEDPLFCTIHPGQATIRNRWITSQVSNRQAVVLIDMGDAASTTSPYFRETPALKLKRERLPWASEDGVLPFPFLYQPELLYLELSGGLDVLRKEAREVREPREALAPDRKEVLFAGTVSHWRYMGRRASLLELWKDRNPDLQLRVVEGGLTLMQTWKELQACDLALSLPGRGELCFRHHELAALGIPAIAPEEFHIQVPKEWRQAFPTELSKTLDREGMLAFYRNHYHPSCAAAWLMRLLGEQQEPASSRPTPCVP